MDDDKILDLYFARNEEAIAETAKKYGAVLTRLTRSITGNDEDAEECVNDAYLAAWKSIPPERPAYFCAWLCSVARTLCAKIFEKKRAGKRSALIVELTEELTDCLPSPGSVEDAVEAKELSKALDAFLRGLDERAQIVFMKRYYWSAPIGEIAAQTGLSEGAVKQLLFRTRTKLRKTLQKENLL
ncbi:MAG: sigma-70 family RNA polymerase sigma factor [Clostridia bacterium]|nr:sigma-70 family RNA polymerase sigma factor [Clostridia bacterium]